MKILNIIFIVAIFCGNILASREIIDQTGRKIILPNNVERIVVLQHQSLNLLNEINALSKVVGIQKSWQNRLGSNYTKLAPNLPNLPIVGDLNSINLEATLALKPDVVIVANYMPKEYINKLENAGVPVVAMSFFSVSSDEKYKQHPNLKDAFNAYDDGFYEAVRILGTVANRETEAQELIDYVKKAQAEIKKELAFLAEKKQLKTVYVAVPFFETYGSGKYPEVLFRRAGAVNVAASTIKGYAKVSPEQILKWNPEVIFAQNRYPQAIDEIKNTSALSSLQALKSGQIYLMPEYAKAWGHPSASDMALGELWVAKTLYKDELAHIDLDAKVQEFYHKFYRTSYQK
ncbi:ABC transporter substrate-binding protein [Campylobacter sp. 19-13652]|uniref:ABC transporter substrate-binding protein n=1 Tax=Campylobacter sp. 19-13652 TaxID=2840180 RepID=UPI001C777E70|nr:ABC transporter substrate-binding protein [Campylobacter sp. 19-13652]BCX79960.1 hypothetical protein LBC_14220 [Campylobacter sp. 19-13652]